MNNVVRSLLQYLIRVRQNIHVVVTMSPMGEMFRSRLRMFPGLVNCCTIDWFSEWPDDALLNVAMQSLTETDLKLDDNLPKVRAFAAVAVPSLCSRCSRGSC